MSDAPASIIGKLTIENSELNARIEAMRAECDKCAKDHAREIATSDSLIKELRGKLEIERHAQALGIEQSAKHFTETPPTRSELMSYVENVENVVDRKISEHASTIRPSDIEWMINLIDARLRSTTLQDTNCFCPTKPIMKHADHQFIQNIVKAEVVAYLTGDASLKHKSMLSPHIQQCMIYGRLIHEEAELTQSLKQYIDKKVTNSIDQRMNDRGVALDEVTKVADEAARKRVIDSREKHEHAMHKSTGPRRFTSIRVHFTIASCHQWMDAPDAVKDLRNLHHHDFHFQVDIEVKHLDRELEFRMVVNTLKPELIKLIDTISPSIRSCERMASICCDLIQERYGQRDVQCIVSEDGHNGSMHCILN